MLEYRMSKHDVLEQIFPEEVGFLLDEAQRLKVEALQELIQVYHGDPKKNMERLGGKVKEVQTEVTEPDEVTREKGAMQLAIWSGNLDYARKIQLYKKANEHSKAVKNG